MRGGTGDQVSDRRAAQTKSLAQVPEDPETAGMVAGFVDGARAARNILEVYSLVARLAQTDGVRAARLGPVPVPGGDPVASLLAALPAESPAEIVREVGPKQWRLELRVAFSDAGCYARLSHVVGDIATAAERALRTPCQAMTNPPWSTPYTMYAAICAKTPQVIVLIDPVEGWLPLSDAFVTTLGYDRHTPPSGGPLSLVHPDDHAAALATFVSCCSGRRACPPVDLRIRAASGQWLTMEVTARVFVTEGGTMIVAYFATDVTAGRDAAHTTTLERVRLGMLAETLPHGVLILDDAGKIELLNTTGKRLLHLGRHEVDQVRDVNALLAAVKHQLADQGVAEQHMRDRLRGDQALVGGELEFVDGHVVDLDVVPLECENTSIGVLVHLRDVTARVAKNRMIAAAAAARGFSGLQGGGLRGGGVRDAGAHERMLAHERVVAEANAMNNEFVSMVAHELRAPLSSVVAFSCLLGEPSSGELSEDQRSHLSVIDRNADRLLRLIEDLLLVSRLESRTIQPSKEAVRLIDLLGAAVTEHEPVAAAAGIELRRDTAEQGPDLVGDGAMLYKVIGNLIDNALRFTPRGGRVTVRSRYERNAWMIMIADTGIGIPAVDLPMLFTAFFRGSNVTASAGRSASPGAGLGLVVCRAIVELHGGAIQVASTEGIGTTVTVTFPAVDAARGTSTNIGG